LIRIEIPTCGHCQTCCLLVQAPYNELMFQKCNTCMTHIWLNASSTKGVMTLIQVLHLKKKNLVCDLYFEYLQSNLICDPDASIVVYIPLILFCFCAPNVNIANVVFISMENKHRKYEYCIFYIDGFLCL
jgi:hypothetical protein